MRREVIVRVRIVPDFSWLDALKLRLAGARAVEKIIRRQCEDVRLAKLIGTEPSK